MQAAFRGSIFHCLADPGEQADASAIEYFEDGVLLVEDGQVVTVGAAESLLPGLSENTRIEDCSGRVYRCTT